MVGLNGGAGFPWLGGRLRRSTFSFVWTDGTPWDYENWITGEPDNKLGKENILGINGGWFDDGAEVDNVA